MKKFQVTLVIEGRKWEIESDDLVHLTAQLMLKLVQITKDLDEEEMSYIRGKFSNDEDIPF